MFEDIVSWEEKNKNSKLNLKKQPKTKNEPNRELGIKICKLT